MTLTLWAVFMTLLAPATVAALAEVAEFELEPDGLTQHEPAGSGPPERTKDD